MAEKPGRRSFPTHPLVAKLLGDAAEPGREVVLVGYIGPSSTPDRVRLYLDLALNRYIEIPADAIRDTWPADPDDENSPTHVAVDGKADLDEVTTVRRSTGARFLQGPIVDQYGVGAAGAAQPTTYSTATVCTHYGCPPTPATVCTQFGCPPTPATVCTQAPGCPQRTWICGPGGVPQTMLGCPRTVSCPPHNTLATVCTQPYVCPPQNTAATVCTQVQCPPTWRGICVTEGFGAPQPAPPTARCLPPPPTPACPSVPWVCPVTLDCPPPSLDCPSVALLCPQVPTPACPTPTVTWRCPPVQSPACMPTLAGCPGRTDWNCPTHYCPSIACGTVEATAGCG